MLIVTLLFFRQQTREKHVIHLLSDYIDGRLTEQDRAMVDAHTSSCASCRGELESFKATVSLLKTLPSLKAPRSFTIAPSYRAALVTYRPPVVARALMGAAASFLFVSLIGVYLLAYYPTEVAAPSKEDASTKALTQPAVPGAETKVEGPPLPPAPMLRGLEAAPETGAPPKPVDVTPQAQQEEKPQPAPTTPSAKQGQPIEGPGFLRNIGLWMFLGGLVGSSFLLMARFFLTRRRGQLEESIRPRTLER